MAAICNMYRPGGSFSPSFNPPAAANRCWLPGGATSVLGGAVSTFSLPRQMVVAAWTGVVAL